LTLWGFNLGFFAQTTEAYLRADPTEKLEAMNALVPLGSKYSCGFSMVIFQQITQAFFTADWHGWPPAVGGGRV